MRVRISLTASTASTPAGTITSSQRRATGVTCCRARFGPPAAACSSPRRSALPDSLVAAKPLLARPVSLAADGVLDPVEHVARVVARLIGRALEVAQLLVEVALVLRERARHGDVEVHELVAAAAGAQVRHTLSAQPDHLTVLRPGRHADGRLDAVDRRHRELLAQRGLGRRDAQDVDQVVAFAPEQVVVLDADEDIEVARWSAAQARLTLTRDAQLLAVVDARRERELELFVAALAALAAALGADLVDRLARAAAARAGRDVHEAAEDRLLHLPDLAAAVAGAAGGDLRAGLGAAALAVGARLETRDTDGALAALHRVDELDLDLHPEVRAAHRAARLAAPELGAEERLEQVADAEVAQAALGVPEHVVALPALGIRQDLVGLGDLVELLRGVRGLVHVRVVLPGELPVGAADLLLRRVPLEAQKGVVIGGGRH